MIYLDELFGEGRIEEEITKGMLTARETGNYVVYNYTRGCQYSRGWNAVTLACRGLIATRDGLIVARPFPKFFNWFEPEAPEWGEGTYQVHEKLDGSLGIVFNHQGKILVSTRGFMDSEIAQKGREIWRRNHNDVELPEGQTLLVEIIGPWNKVQVDYQGDEKLVGLGMIDNRSGCDLELPETWNGEIARDYSELFRDKDKLLAEMQRGGTGQEGFVVSFGPPESPKTRVKLKYQDYIVLQRAMAGLTPKRLWQHVVADWGYAHDWNAKDAAKAGHGSPEELGSLLDLQGEAVSKMLVNIPEEQREWADRLLEHYRTSIEGLYTKVDELLDSVKHLGDREAAEALRDEPLTTAVMRKRKGRAWESAVVASFDIG